MKFKLIRLFFLCVLAILCPKLSAQKMALDEYRAEIGVSGGGSYYLGEANKQLFKNMQLSYGGFFRYRFDPRLSARVELTGTTVISNMVYAADFCGEFNFFDLEKNEYKLFSKIFSPYIFAGVGEVYIPNSDTTKTSASIPFGLGMKVKLGKRWNLNVQWSNRILFRDNLKGMKKFDNPNGLNGSNIFNNDLLSTLTVGISYDIWKKQCDCENSTVIQDKHKYKKR